MASATGSYATPRALKLRTDIPDTADDELLAAICDQVNGLVESIAGRAIAPVAGTAVKTFDGNGRNRLYIDAGLRTVTKLELAQYTNAAYVEIPTTDYFLGPDQPEEGWPYTELWLSDVPASSSFGIFPRGFRTVRITGTWGWAAIPDEITDVALTIAVRTWIGRQSGVGDVAGPDGLSFAAPSNFISGRDRETLRRYTAPSRLV